METPPQNGANHLSGTIAGNTFALNTRDLVSVLLLGGIFVLGYLVWQGQRAAMRLLYDGQLAITRHLEEQDTHRREQTAHIIRLVYALDYNQNQPPEKRIPLHLFDDKHGPREER